MFEYLFSIFDIPLTCILILLVLFGMFFIKNIYNVILSLFVGIFFIIFIASTMLTQQIYLGEFLVIGIFFILAVIFFVYNLNDDFDDSQIANDKKSKFKIFLSILSFVFLFTVIGLNFEKIDNSNNKFILKNDLIKNDLKLSTEQEKEQTYDGYVENISLLNQNKIFQKLTHIVMFYVCLVVILYFFNRRNDSDEG